MGPPVAREARHEPPETKVAKNRPQDPEDWYVVLQDPEGNEFCLV